MKLSDVMSAAGLAIYAELGLLLFLGAFLAVAIKVLFFTKSQAFEQAGMIPLDEEQSELSIRAVSSEEMEK